MVGAAGDVHLAVIRILGEVQLLHFHPLLIHPVGEPACGEHKRLLPFLEEAGGRLDEHDVGPLDDGRLALGIGAVVECARTQEGDEKEEGNCPHPSFFPLTVGM